MNNQNIVAKAIYDVVKDDLTLEQILRFLETTKSKEKVEVANPARGTAKAYFIASAVFA
mgnify:CR=1 FL=1